MNYKTSTFFVICCSFCLVTTLRTSAAGKYSGIEFLDPCNKTHPKFEDCLTKSINSLATRLKEGLPTLGYTEVEPIVLDELHISLGGGIDGYQAHFQNIEARGVSNAKVTASKIRITEEEVQVQISLFIPKISAIARYTSSGTLILVQASGAGDYWGEYDGVRAKIFIRARLDNSSDRSLLKLQQLKLDFTVKDIKMGVDNVKDGNTIIQAALNLFINSNGQELLQEMKPQLKRKLVQQLSTFVKNVFNKIPYGAFVMEN